MAYTMYDSTTAADIPTTAKMVAGYVDGLYAWTQADWDRFPDAIKVRIAIFPSTNDGHVFDVEPGAGQPKDAAKWVRARWAAGISIPVLYVALWTPKGWAKNIYETTKDALVAAGIDLTRVAFWVANYDNKAEVPAGFVAKQYANDALSGGHYDLSVVGPTAPWIPAAPFKPAPAPVAPVTNGDKMTGYVKVATNGAVYCYGDVLYCGGFEKDLTNGEVIVQVRLTKTHKGYIAFGNAGGIFAKGDAVYLGGGADKNPAGFLAADAG